jgi:hypothetical protein
MNLIKTIVKPPWRTLSACILLASIFLLGYQLWSPGKVVRDGSHDLKANGIWMQHGWLGDDKWFKRYKKKPEKFRKTQKIIQLKNLLVKHHITDLYPHLCPCRKTGEISAVDPQQTRNFLLIMDEVRVIPWVGGVLGLHAFPGSPAWRHRFIKSILDLLQTYPAISGIHINIEPMPSGNQDFIELLQELRSQFPAGKIISISAYPPPTFHQQTLDVHWEKAYYAKVAQEVDQIVVMMYDTSLRFQKLYRHLMASWTREVLEWSGTTQVLLGVPAYDDEGVQYHYPHVENLKNSLLGIHAGLSGYRSLPVNYSGIAIYSDWEMQPDEWNYLQMNYSKK